MLLVYKSIVLQNNDGKKRHTLSESLHWEHQARIALPSTFQASYDQKTMLGFSREDGSRVLLEVEVSLLMSMLGRR